MARIAVIGGGISGLSLAHALRVYDNAEVVVFEAEKRPGGKIRTEKAQGFTAEWGVNGFLDKSARPFELAESLSITPLKSSDAARRRFIYVNGALRLLPESPPAFLTSGIMGVAGKLRIMLEPFIPKGGGQDETLADFARRRLGKEAYETLIDPMASGIFAGDPEKMSLRSCFPRIHELESEYGSLIKALISLQREAKKKKTGKKVGPAPGGKLTSFPGGMQDIVTALKDELGESLRLGNGVATVEKTGGRYELHLEDGSMEEADAVALAVPAYAAAAMLRGLDAGAAGLLSEIPYPALSVLCMGYRREQIRVDVDYFGFLVPAKEGRKILGAVLDSSVFEHRAPEGHVLLRVMVGGARAPGLAMAPEETVISTAQDELRHLAGIKAEPVFMRLYRHEQAIPQYNVGHSERLKALELALGRHPGLYVTGNALRGISFIDCLENSLKISNRIKEDYLS